MRHACIEVRQRSDSPADAAEVRSVVVECVQSAAHIPRWRENPFLNTHVERITIDDGDTFENPQVYVYQPCAVDNVDEFSVGDPAEALDTCLLYTSDAADE